MDRKSLQALLDSMPDEPMPKIKVVTCSFCDVKNDARELMVASENEVYICDKCIEICAMILCGWRAERKKAQKGEKCRIAE